MIIISYFRYTLYYTKYKCCPQTCQGKANDTISLSLSVSLSLCLSLSLSLSLSRYVYICYTTYPRNSNYYELHDNFDMKKEMSCIQ